MSVSDKISIICPACNNKFLLKLDPDLKTGMAVEPELKSNLELLQSNDIQGFNAKFHCGCCDYSFEYEINKSCLISAASPDITDSDAVDSSSSNTDQDKSDSSAPQITNADSVELDSSELDSADLDPDDTQGILEIPDFYAEDPANQSKEVLNTSESPELEPPLYNINESESITDNEADQTYVIPEDVVEQISSEQSSSRIEDFNWGSEDQLKTPDSVANYDLTQPEVRDTFQLSTKDSSETAVNYNLKDVAENFPKFEQERLTDYSSDQEDYSKYVVDNYAQVDDANNLSEPTTERARQQTLWAAEQDHKTEPKQEYIDSGETLITANKPTLDGRTFMAPKLNESIGFLENSDNRRASSYTAILMILPILITLAALSAATFHLENNLKSADYLFTNLFPSSLREPPAGLYILEPDIRPLVLESGDIVNVAQGKLVNKTNRTFNAVQIEGIGFSATGQISQRERIMLGNPVSNKTTKLKTLVPSNIKEVQSKLVNKSIKLRPNSEQDFIFVFTEPVSPRVLEQSKNKEAQNINSKDMSSYALRIYAVR